MFETTGEGRRGRLREHRQRRESNRPLALRSSVAAHAIRDSHGARWFLAPCSRGVSPARPHPHPTHRCAPGRGRVQWRLPNGVLRPGVSRLQPSSSSCASACEEKDYKGFHAFPSNTTKDGPPITRDCPPSLLTSQGRSLTFCCSPSCASCTPRQEQRQAAMKKRSKQIGTQSTHDTAETML